MGPDDLTGGVQVVAFLADAVSAADGKLYALGAGWNHLHTKGFPVRHDRVGLGLLISVPYTDTDRPHSVVVRLVDSDGAPIALGQDATGAALPELGGELRVGRPPDLVPGDEQVVPMAINIDGLVFEQPGRYSFVVEIDGAPVTHLSFRVQ